MLKKFWKVLYKSAAQNPAREVSLMVRYLDISYKLFTTISDFLIDSKYQNSNAFQVPRLEIFVERNNTRVIKGFKIIWKHVKLFIYSDGFKILVLWIMPRAMPLSRQPINGSLLLSVETSDISSVLQVTVVSGPDMLGHFFPGKLAFFLGKTVSSKLINIWILLLRKSRAGAQRVSAWHSIGAWLYHFWWLSSLIHC